jgi:HD-GYP domain-containing protein (c-di-GMP phosphodiesterase class II)
VVKARVKTHLRLKKSQQDLQDLLSKTFSGTITVLTDILSLTNPIAFKHTKRIKNYVVMIARELGLPELWKYELAAMLSQIGCITVPPKILEHIYSGKKITDEDAKLYTDHPKVAYELLKSIPRLESVAKMIASQYDPHQPSNGGFEKNSVKLGGHILNIAHDFDQLSASGASPEMAISQMRTVTQKYPSQLLDVLEHLFHRPTSEQSILKTNVSLLKEGMVLVDDIYRDNQLLLVRKGTELTLTIIKSLQRHAQSKKINNELRVIESYQETNVKN